jgi:RNA-splicing ligase RtcB
VSVEHAPFRATLSRRDRELRITGSLIREFGYQPASWWKDAIGEAGGRDFADPAQAREYLDGFAPPPAMPLRASRALRWTANIEAEDEAERANIEAVSRHMDELMRVPTVVAGAVMPDACPSDHRLGAIPVGGVAATRDAIHPGMHSADICCSMAVTIFDSGSDAGRILDAGMKLSHFGAGGRAAGGQIQPAPELLEAFERNIFLKPLINAAIEHNATQGDGNHFFYVGRVRSSGRVALVTHHGSRGPGGKLYAAGMTSAERFRRQASPETPAHNAWIPSETREGESYWEALQLIRAWTKGNHFAIHDLIAATLGLRADDRFWNEHNFVFRRSDGLFYHAKGATPAYADFSSDTNGLTLIPLNMAEPILITRGLDAAAGLGFSPHGAGRNFSRSAYVKQNAGKSEADLIAEQAPGIDVRYFSGIPDVSELPGAYKNAASMRRQIAKFGLAKVVDQIDPIGNIMAGDWQRVAPWRKKRLPALDAG